MTTKTAFEKAVDIGNRDRVLMLLDPERQAQGRIEMMEAVIKTRAQARGAFKRWSGPELHRRRKR